MKYLTKEWYNRMQKTHLYFSLNVNEKAEEFSESYYKEVYNKEKEKYLKRELNFINFQNYKKLLLENEDTQDMTDEEIKEQFDQYKLGEYQSMTIEEWFDNCKNFMMQDFKTKLPKEILDKVKDLRILALGYVSDEVYNLIKEYCDNNEKYVEDKIRECEKEEEKQFKNENIEFLKHSFHDCLIININKKNSDLEIVLDNEYGFTNKTSIILKNYNIILDENIKGCNWLYNEIYKLDKGYELHILAVQNDGDILRELIVSCNDIILE